MMDHLSDSPVEWENDTFEDTIIHKQNWNSKDHILFLIDASKPMFQKYCDKKNFFTLCIESCKATVLDTIKKCKNDKIGLILFGTSNINKTYPKFLNVLFEIKKPNVEFIKMLDELLTVDETKFGQSSICPIADAIWYGSFLITKFKEKQCHSSIIFMTCCDKPQINNKKTLYKRLNDIIKNKIEFKFIPLGAKFSITNFYKDLFYDFNVISKPSNGFINTNDIVSTVNNLNRKQRSVNTLKFNIDNSTFFTVSLYNFYSEQKIQPIVKLDKCTNEIVESLRQAFHAETDEVIPKSNLAKVCNISNKNIFFQNEEFLIINDMMEPSIRLLGFKSTENFHVYYHYKSGSFIQPNEKVEGSYTIFNCLLECCLKMNKIAICFIKVRNGGLINLAALVPQPHIQDDQGNQIEPPGFHIMYLPYAECLRDVPADSKVSNCQLNDYHIQIASQIIDNMPIKDNPTMISNPKIDFHWAMLEAIAFNIEKPEVIDGTVPDFNFIDKNLSNLKNDIFGKLIPLDYHPSSIVTSKRQASNSNHIEMVKKFRKIPDYYRMKDLVSKKLVDKLTVNELRQFLKDNGIQNTGNKFELVNKVYDSFKI
ncbi:X-ray repair cross-complementing protein 5 isoform X2 [Daktulosphaira vitifoliae]|nr:X-ray repair cross-complementing protein 5 isoform X2 [Daktulosphaira vitifoliae]XP_050544435.1 X-ray repair cross-complementing protein 5 isoform X2 [Daktulosphaira vitifoliae]XP_050544436.1 X-ray repair cross-complementing protein 5 isoform X2 [Daktulosphaira vitifoliae]XP_050544437.1 X-ray repair cross-complementing protein 5 isoform X2 [Daktulosphaira vitifoliae]XP_050544438.1 X-ray repair cross-complementing protein 5 isoform X2 [Daktulosphaira vitifoliae]